jgi:multidrug resistance efflux pump
MIVCSGRVEPARGEVDVSSQIEGQLAEVRVSEGDAVKEGEILAVLEAPREAAEHSVAEANVAIARARLERIQAGNGQEEIQQALHELEAQEAVLTFETSQLGRINRLLQRRAASQEDFDRQSRKVEQMQRQRDGLRKRYEAIRRGPLAEEIAVARAELDLAEKRLRRTRVELDLRVIRAPMAGEILEVYRHAGDSVITDQPTPILRMADTSRLRIRLEIDEVSVARLRLGLQGTFQIRGDSTDVGRLAVTTIIPMFGPKRLFNPDTSARYDTRTLGVFCTPLESRVPLYPGQRVSANLVDAPRTATTPRGAGRDPSGPPSADTAPRTSRHAAARAPVP